MNLDFAKLCGKHTNVYEAYYKQIDPKGMGTIEAMTGAKFLKKSGLSDIVLSRVWDLADPNGKGYLDKPGFFVALKMVSVAQAGETVNMKNIYFDTENPPKVGEIPKNIPPKIPAGPAIAPGIGGGGGGGGVGAIDWSISVIDRLKYEQLFVSLKPVNGMLPGNKVKGVLLDSKLPMDTLGKIWDLADQDRDGNLDKHEFLVAMHLVYKTLEKRTVPDVLPPELRKPGAGVTGGPPPKPAPPVMGGGVGAAVPKAPSGEGFGDGGFVANFPKDIGPPPAVPPIPGAIPPMTRVPPIGAPITTQPLLSTDPLIPIGAPPSVTANADWVVTPNELQRYEVMFRDSDRDKDGLVSGLEVKNIFLQSGVPQNCLAHIWALCDTNQSGKLTLEQFGLAMWMVERKQKGIEPPQVLTANMVPPSMRDIISGVDVQQQEPKPTYSNPELEMISKEIEELAKERRSLETEIAQKEADIRIKNGEVRSLQSELDTLSATLKQLEHQRGEAEKRLDDLKNQVNRIREQCQKQEDTINEQEGELNAKRSEFQKLKDEETALQKEYDDNNRELQKLTNHLQNTQLQISSVRSMVTQLMETQRQMTDALLICRAAIESENAELVSEYQLKMEPDLDEARKTLEKQIEEPKADPFSDTKTSPVGSTIKNGFGMNGFDSDPFGANGDNKKTSAIGGFDDSFNATSAFDSGFDAFGSNNTTGGFGQQQKDPFGGDAFGSKANAVTPEPGKDDFGSDPFAALHAPTGKGQVLSPNTQKSGPPARPESPSPALPPKKSKVPPPRPAPPRPLQGPARPAQPSSDAFGSSATSSGSFADFADFDNKLSSIPTFAPFSSSTNSISSNSIVANFTTATANTTSISTTKSTTSPLKSPNSNLFTQNSSLFDLSSISFNTASTTTTTSISTTTSITTTASSTLRPQSIINQPISSSFSLTNLSSNMPLSSSNVNIDSLTTSSSITKTPAITDNQLTRSTTPLVQQGSPNFFNTTNTSTTTIATVTESATATGTGKGTRKSFPSNMSSSLSTPSSPSSSRNPTITPVVAGPTDFSDDPFKDYRYDDLCNIQDPFADDEDLDPEKIFKDIDFPVEDSGKKNFKEPTPISKTSANKVSNELLNKFDAFHLSPSPVPSNKSTDSGSKQITLNNEINSSGSFGIGVGVGFGSLKSKSQSTTPIPNLPQAADTFGNFADFDAFSSKSSVSSTKDSTASNHTDALKQNDIFFDAFGDFNKEEKNTKTLDSNANIFDAFSGADSKAKTQIKDPFGLATTDAEAFKKNSTGFNAFEDNDSNDTFGFDANFNNIAGATAQVFDAFSDQSFAQDFYKNSTTNTMNTNNNHTLNSKSDIGINDAFNANFAKFDAFNNNDNSPFSTNSNKMILNPNLNNYKDLTKSPVDFASAFGDSSPGASNNGKNLSLRNLKKPPASIKTPRPVTSKSPTNYASTFDDSSSGAFNSLKNNYLQNLKSHTLLAKTPNSASTKSNLNHIESNPSSSNPVKLPEKFAADYSKPETFDDDLEEAIQRSMIDQ